MSVDPAAGTRSAGAIGRRAASATSAGPWSVASGRAVRDAPSPAGTASDTGRAGATTSAGNQHLGPAANHVRCPVATGTAQVRAAVEASGAATVDTAAAVPTRPEATMSGAANIDRQRLARRDADRRLEFAAKTTALRRREDGGASLGAEDVSGGGGNPRGDDEGLSGTRGKEGRRRCGDHQAGDPDDARGQDRCGETRPEATGQAVLSIADGRRVVAVRLSPRSLGTARKVAEPAPVGRSERSGSRRLGAGIDFLSNVT